MTSRVRTDAPADNEQLRRALYDGAIFRLAPVPATKRLVAEVLTLLEHEFGEGGPIREAQHRMSGDAMFRAVGRLRKSLYEGPRFIDAMREVAAAHGFDPGRHAFDPLRLRAVTHRGHENPKAAAIYYAHRDTWYSHPQCHLGWWVPLHDLTERQTFEFFPEHLRAPVENNSGDFDYDDWSRDRRGLRIGWQDKDAGTMVLYPGFHGDLSRAPRLPFACRAGEVILFAGAHLHQTVPNTTGVTRFSVDFRTAHLGDCRRGVGAPNVDNRSTGSALPTYFHPPGCGTEGGTGGGTGAGSGEAVGE